jgi:hypothetical protein
MAFQKSSVSAAEAGFGFGRSMIPPNGPSCGGLYSTNLPGAGQDSQNS